MIELTKAELINPKPGIFVVLGSFPEEFLKSP